MSEDGEKFQAAVSALFAPNEYAFSLFYEHGKDGHGSLIDLRAVQDPTKLPQYWTLSCPQYIDLNQWDNPYVDFHWCEHTRRQQHIFFTGREPLSDTAAGRGGVLCDAFIEYSPFLVFEVDYLLCEKDEDEENKLPPDQVKLRRALQAEAMAVAFQRTNFPFSVLVHSGSKSIHAFVRLSDPLDTVAAFRSGDAFKLLQELAWTVFGHYDQNVMKESGRVRLVRTPGATRDNGAVQQILATGKPTTINDLFQWFYRQLSPAACQEITSRPAIPKQSPLRKYWLRAHKWRPDIAQLHEQGERGGHWFFVSKSLMLAGARRPHMLRRPQQPGDLGDWDASWLWWASAVIFDRYARGWFFSHRPEDFQDENERVRWDDDSTISGYVVDQRKFEKFDPVTAAIADTLVLGVEQEQEQRVNTSLDGGALPALADAPGANAPQHHTGGITGAQAPVESAANPPRAGAQPEKEKKAPKGVDYNAIVETMKIHTELPGLIKMGTHFGGDWMKYNGKYWQRTSDDYIRYLLHRDLMKEMMEKHKTEVIDRLAHECLQESIWDENSEAVAFINGTLYIHDNVVSFASGHNPDDNLRSIINFSYEKDAQCPQWNACMERFLPDETRRAVVQEMMGYTLMAGQAYQTFFLLLGSGANFKGTLLRVIEAMHGGGVVAVSVAALARQFALGRVADKRVAIDGEADQLAGKRDTSEIGNITSVIKAWTGGDAMSIEEKGVQSWTARMNPKLIMAANRRPRLVDSTKGVWRRLKMIKFEVTISQEEMKPNFHVDLIQQEMPGIINWAVEGLRRLLANDKFTHSPAMDKDALEYQEDMDSVLRFKQDFMKREICAEAWYDLRPVFKVYRFYCEEVLAQACGETEFRNRLEQYNIEVRKPPLTEAVHGVPQGGAQPNGTHYWALRGWSCTHPAMHDIPTQGLYPKQMQPPIQFPAKGHI